MLFRSTTHLSLSLCLPLPSPPAPLSLSLSTGREGRDTLSLSLYPLNRIQEIQEMVSLACIHHPAAAGGIVDLHIYIRRPASGLGQRTPACIWIGLRGRCFRKDAGVMSRICWGC